ncbi:sodium/calcium exchanger 3 isoform X2 [Cryptotermes secundus]|uniref:sodium/calcium exchanger 3 isoform X2 n=1 Tax=Cryptotermes secundus TaxID=105785 RepID=UPI000CD7D186|nr:sodium/calcium exchanger 3 isoform X2 [Cryptotermes secundus]
MAASAAMLLLALSLVVDVSEASKPDNATQQCEDGLLLPVWLPLDNLSIGDRVARGLVYFSAMLYLFIGVSIISDRFMAAIEVITSQEKEITVRKKSGETQILVVRVWNETVANLTLMALGSSAPEILLSIIEIYAKNFEAGDLGPGTIVGSAAYNLFVIIAICVMVIPEGQVRKIKHLRVFFVTATWSVFAYVWLYIILSVSSVGEVEVWEGLLTFMFFPATVITAYIADRRLLIYKYLHKNYRMNRRGVIVQSEGDVEMSNKINHIDGGLKTLEEEAESEEVREFEQNRREYITTLRELRKKYPAMDLEQLEIMAQEEVLNKGPKSRAFYRIQATRKMVGGGNIMKKIQERAQSDLSEVKAELQREEDSGIKVFFDPGHYTVMENVGEFEVRVVREGGDSNQVIMVDYATEDGSANAGSDYVSTRGTLVFRPGETFQTFRLQVIDDDVFEEDEHFYVRLSNLRTGQSNGDAAPAPIRRLSAKPLPPPPAPQLVSPSLATVMILDDDHGGVFSFPEKDVELVESVGQCELRVVRCSGARGRVSVSYYTEDGTAKAGKEYEAAHGELIFENNESEKTIPVSIIDEDSYEKDVLFYAQLGEIRMLDEAGLAAVAERKRPEDRTEADKMALLGRPRLGDITRAQIRIKESKEFKNTVDKLVQRANASILIGTSSWKEQFIEAITVSPGDDGGGDDDEEEKLPSCGDYVMHFITLFWKLLFAFVPPTDMFDGYLCFVISICGIGCLTAVIGDVASHFGCTVGLKDAVTAVAFVALGTSVPDVAQGYVCFCISILWIGFLTALIGDVASHFGCSVNLKDSVTAIGLVAMGTSLPDTFASKVAAIQDKYADASVGNVTGSNAVNVFLGIGVAWSLAAIYHAIKGEKFLVEPGNLAFSVTIFCSEAFIAILILLLRRSKVVGGELGGPKYFKYITSLVLIFLWLMYLLMATLEAYDVIEGF